MFTLGNSQAGIGLLITLHDNFTNTSRKVSAEMGRLSHTAKDAAKTGYAAGREYKAMAMAAGGAATLYFLHGAVKQYARLNYTLTQASIISTNSADSVGALEQSAKALSQQYGVSVMEISDAYLMLTRAGLSITDQIKVMPDFIRGSIAMGSSLEFTASKGTDMMTTFNKGANESGSMMAKMSIGANAANMDFRELSKTMEYVGVSARLAELSPEEIIAVSGALHNAGLKSTKAGVAMGNYVTQIANAMGQFKTTRQATVLEAIGLDESDVIDTATGKYRNLVDIMEISAKKIQTLPVSQRPGFLKALVNERGSKAILAGLTSEMGSSARQIYEKLINPDIDKVFKKQVDDMMDTPEMKLKKLEAAWLNFQKSVGKAIWPLIRPLTLILTHLANFLAFIADSKIGQVLIIAVGSAALLVTAFSSIYLIARMIGMAITGWGIASTPFKAILSGLGRVGAKGALANSGIVAGVFKSGTRAGKTYYKSAGKFISAKPYLAAGGASSLFSMGSMRRFPMLLRIAKIGRFFGNILDKATGVLSKFVPWLSKFVPWIARALGFAARILTGPIGWIYSIASIFLTFGEIVELTTKALADFAALMYTFSTPQGWWDMLKGGLTGDSPLTVYEKNRFETRKALGVEEESKFANYKNYAAGQDIRDQLYKQSTAQDLNDFNERMVLESMGYFAKGKPLSEGEMINAHQNEYDRIAASRKEKQTQYTNLTIAVDGTKIVEKAVENKVNASNLFMVE